VSIEIAGSVVRRGAAAAAVRRRLDSSAGTEFRDPEEVVGRADQMGGKPGPLQAAIAGAAEAADRLEPAEDLLDPLAHELTDSISRPADGAQVEGRTTWPPLILRHVRRDVERPAARNELGSIVTLVGRNGDPVKPPPLQHLQPLLAFGPAGGLSHAQVDHDPVAILHQHTLGVAELRLLREQGASG
jgi:hypothetical protein